MVYVSFEQFLEEAAFIPGRRLRKRIRKELGDHMEDMLADKIEAGTDEGEAKKQVLSEMGDPAVLRKAFIRAHIAEIRVTRLGILLSLAVLCFCALFLVPPVYDELRTYHSSMSVEEAEQYLAEQTGEAFTFLGEVDYEGRIYRFYLPEKPSPYYRRLIYFSSIRFFGKNIPDRFFAFSECRQSNASPIVFNFFLQEHNAAYSAGIAPWQKTPEERDLPCSYAYIFTYASNAACFQPMFLTNGQHSITGKDELTAGAKIPIKDTPCIIRVDAPEDMYLFCTEYYDAHGNAVEPAAASDDSAVTN